jgi:hypothetical protein
MEGGGMRLFSSSSSSVSIDECEIIECKTKKREGEEVERSKGGGIYLEVKDIESENLPSLSSLSFCENYASIGLNLFCSCCFPLLLQNVVKKEEFGFKGIISKERNEYMGEDSLVHQKGINLFLLFIHHSDGIYVNGDSSDSSDVDNCGSSSFSCSSFSVGVSHVFFEEKEEGRIFVEKTVEERKEVKLSDINVKGRGDFPSLSYSSLSSAVEYFTIFFSFSFCLF